MSELKENIRALIVFILTWQAKAVLKKYRPKILVVTGSVGKTSSKDAAYTALSGSFFVRKSQKSFNSDIGVPLAVLGVPNGWGNAVQWFKNILEGFLLLLLPAPYPKWLVVEVGADRPGDITKSLLWLQPDAVLATRFPDIPVHVEFYESPDSVAEEELAPVGWLAAGGAAILNADDEKAKNAAVPEGAIRITYGFGGDADVRGMRYLVTTKNKMPTGIAFDVQRNDERAHVSVPGVIGKTHAQAFIAGIAAAVAVGVPLSKAAAGFERHDTPPGRARLIMGIRGSVLIDDTYNASPAAAEEALKTLAEIPRNGKRIAVLADMLELGEFSVAEHKRIGQLAATSADVLVTVGVRSRGIAEAAREAGMPAESVVECDKSEAAAAKVKEMLAEGDIVLLKGSQSMRMERAVLHLMAEPEKAKKLLVRQDAEWLSR